MPVGVHLQRVVVVVGGDGLPINSGNCRCRRTKFFRGKSAPCFGTGNGIKSRDFAKTAKTQSLQMRHRVLIGIGDVGFGNLVGVAFFAHTNQLPLGTGSKGIDGFLVGGSFFHGEIVCPISTSVGENLAVALIVVDGGDAPFYIGRLFQFVIGDFTQGRQHHYGAIVYGTGVVGAVWDEHTVFIKRSTFCGVAPHAIAESDGIGVDVGAFFI